MNVFEITTGREVLHFDMTAEKVRNPVKAKSGDWRETATQWSVTLTQREYGNMYCLDYFTGSAIKDAPKIGDVLSSIALDSSMADEMPADEMEAMDHYESNFGKSEKSSDTLRIVCVVKLARENVKKLLANTGITLDEFIEKCPKD